MSISASMHLLQFGDSLFPVGSFSFSNALEAAVQQGCVRDTGTLSEFARTSTRRAATSDGIALLHAYRGARQADLGCVALADHAVFDNKLGEEMRTMTVRMGRKLAEVAATTVHAPVLDRWLGQVRGGAVPGTYPVGLGILFADVGSSEADAFAVHQYGVAMTILSAALRLMKIDHIQVQAILADVNHAVSGDYADVRDASLADIATFAPMADILAAMHVRSRIRLFMS